MKINLTITKWLALAALLSLNLQPSTARAQGTTAFTYQGQLHDNGTNANGAYTMIFALYDAVSGGNQIGGAIATSATLVNGLFSVNLDFGAGAFDGSARWLDITITNGATTQELAPRVQLLPAPYALYAGTAANLSGAAWNAGVGNYQNYSNVMLFKDNGVLVLGISTNGTVFNDDLQVNGGLQANNVSFNGGGSISGDGQGGLNFNGAIGMLSAVNLNVSSNLSAGNISASGVITANVGFGISGTNGSWLAQIDSGGNISASGSVNASNLTVTSGTLALGSNPAWTLIYSDGNGGVSIGGTVIHPNGINTTGEINVNNGTATIAPNGDIHANWFNGLGVNASIGCTAPYFNTTSDRNLKEKFAPVDHQEILARVASLPISRWNFKTDEQTRHIGPMAQDFYAAFNVGTDDKHIATVDEDGVALAAIQGLNEKLKEKDAQIEALEKRLADLEALVRTSTQK